MASFRKPASVCTRLLIYQADSGTFNTLRTASPVRWQPEWNNCGCRCREMATVQQVYQTHTNSKSSNQGDKKQTQTSDSDKKLSYVDTLKEQVKNVDKMKDGIFNTLTSATVATITLPFRMIDVVLRIKNKMMYDISSVTETLNSHAAEFKKFERNVRGKLNAANEVSQSESKEKQSFQEFMQETNQSIASFYDTSLEVKTKVRSKKTVVPTVLDATDQQINKILNFDKTAASKTSKTVVKKKPVVEKDFVSKVSIDERTRALVHGIKLATSTPSQFTRTEELCKHIIQYPNARNTASKEKVLSYLLKFEKSFDISLQSAARQALALMGYVTPVGGQGIRLLAIDGGGTKGLVAIECLRKLEKMCGRELHQMFDYVCGVSTGALIVAMIFLHRLPLDECESLYKEFSRKMFTRNKLLGTGKLMWNHAFYDSEIWENILKEKIGDKKMIEFSKVAGTVKVSALSTLMNTPRMRMYFFRNYNLPPDVNSEYLGNCNHTMWEVIRASTAAPGYFESYVMGNLVHQDGGLMANNGTALAIHESKLLWPNVPFQCVISLGTGQHLPSLEYSSTKLALKDKVMKIVDSATDTEAVHMTLRDLLPHSTYFRLNPYLSEEFLLDEIREEKIELMKHDTQMYLRKNEIKINKAVNQLTRRRRIHQRVGDHIRLMKDKYT